MPKLLNRSKHEELESNSALQIRNQMERRAENAWKLELAGNLVGLRNFRNLQNFAGCEFSQVAKLPPCALFTSFATIHPALLNSCCPFALFDSFVTFWFSSFFCPHCNGVCYVILVIYKGGLAIKAPRLDTVKKNLLH